MSNGEVCCIIGVCCPAGSVKQRALLIEGLKHHKTDWSELQASDAADKLLKHYNNFADSAAIVAEVDATS
jgi:hypothetical protein